MSDKITVGWREWLSLPELGLENIKAKIDTGARTSALHAFKVEEYHEDGVDMVHFLMHPVQKNMDIIKDCRAKVIDKRWVSDSGGHREKRFVIKTMLVLGKFSWPVEMTLTNRDSMKFRMLLGRTAMKDIIVDPSASYLFGKKTVKKAKKTKVK
jgi:hypothetical protein